VEIRRQKLVLYAERSVQKQKDLTGPTLLEMSGYPCQLRWSTQHWLAVYSREFRSL
jgi:hypothetical protein